MWGFGCRVSGAERWVSGLGFRAWGFRFRGWGLGISGVRPRRGNALHDVHRSLQILPAVVRCKEDRFLPAAASAMACMAFTAVSHSRIAWNRHLAHKGSIAGWQGEVWNPAPQTLNPKP